MLNRMHYNAIASIIAGERAMARGNTDARAILETTRSLALSIADVFARDNERFDRERFYATAGITNPHTATGE